MGGPEYSFVSSPKSLHLIQTLYFILDLRHVLAGLLQSSGVRNSGICQFRVWKLVSFFLMFEGTRLAGSKKFAAS
jgi:hypothetical protein